MRNALSNVRQNHTDRRHQDNLATTPAERADPRLEAGKSVELWSQQRARPSLAKSKFGQTWSGQTWIWPNLVWPNLVIARSNTGVQHRQRGDMVLPVCPKCTLGTADGSKPTLANPTLAIFGQSDFGQSDFGQTDFGQTDFGQR